MMKILKIECNTDCGLAELRMFSREASQIVTSLKSSLVLRSQNKDTIQMSQIYCQYFWLYGI